MRIIEKLHKMINKKRCNMSRVNILDSSITNKIAAGEVVEKPARNS